MWKWMMASAFAMSVVCSSAGAAFKDGNGLYEDCQKDTGFGRGACSGYIIGAMDAFSLRRSEEGKSRCLRPSVNAGQVIDVVINYLRQHPEQRDVPATDIVEAAVRRSFCPRGS